MPRRELSQTVAWSAAKGRSVTTRLSSCSYSCRTEGRTSCRTLRRTSCRTLRRGPCRTECATGLARAAGRRDASLGRSMRAERPKVASRAEPSDPSPADIPQSFGGHSANIPQTFRGHSANIRARSRASAGPPPAHRPPSASPPPRSPQPVQKPAKLCTSVDDTPTRCGVSGMSYPRYIVVKPQEGTTPRR